MIAITGATGLLGQHVIENLPGHKNQQQTDKYHGDHNKDWIKVQNENLIYGLRNNETC